MRTIVAVLAGFLVVVACESPGPSVSISESADSSAPGGERPAAPRSELVRKLLYLAGQALEEGDLDLAEQRLRRVRKLEPGAVEVRVGLARIAMQRGDTEAARLELQPAIAVEGSAEAVDVDVALVWAEIEVAVGRLEEAKRVLYTARRSDPRRYDLLGRLEALTGRAPLANDTGNGVGLERAVTYPFDPGALVEGGRAARALGHGPQSRRWFAEAVWLGDVDRRKSEQAFRELAASDPDWAKRRWVPVHVYADQTVRAETGWRNRLRLLWRSLSVALDPLLHTAFVPISFGSFDSRGEKTLPAIEAAFRASAGRLPSTGLVAAFTDRGPPRRRGAWKLGQAGFFGRNLLVRLEPGAVESRVLAHEILHIYGGVHIADELGSLMNPDGESLDLDPVNVRLARLGHNRLFGPGGIEVNVLPYVDTGKLADVYMRWLDFNLGVRKRGMETAQLESRTSRYVAAMTGQKAARLDSHMADVASFTGYLLLREAKPRAAANLFALAGQLYGRNTPRGREMQEIADRVRTESP